MFIRKLPSPSMSMTVRPGKAAWAPIAAGRPKPPAPSPAPRGCDFPVRRRPQLLLPPGRAHNRVVELPPVADDLPQPLDGVLRQDGVLAVGEAHRLLLAPAIDLPQPVGVLRLERPARG